MTLRERIADWITGGKLTKMGLVVADRILLSGGPVTAWRLNVTP